MAASKKSGESPKRRIAGRTQWAAQFLVAAELARRGYTVAFTMGNNTPVADLMVGAANGKQFWVDVKGQISKSPWLVTKKAAREDLYYILVYLSPEAQGKYTRQPDIFFVLRQSEANGLVDKYAKEHPGDSGKVPGFRFKDPGRFEDAWSKLPT